MELLNLSAIGFIVIFLATLFVFGEVMVRTRGLFALIGIGLMTVYFTYHIAAGDGLWVVALYLIGIAMIVFDGKVTGDGSIALVGVLFMVFGLALPAPDFAYGLLAAMGFLLAAPTAYLFTKVFPKRQLWEKLTLRDRLTGELGYNSMNADYSDLVGQRARTRTPFRPTGTIEVEGKLYSATSDNLWIKEGEDVKVLSVDGTRIVIVPIASEEDNK